MSSTVDSLVESRQLRRRATFWRLAAFGAAAVAVIAIGARVATTWGGAGDYVARVRITGIIANEDATIKQLKALETSRAAAVLLDIDSPGGTTAGSEELYLAERDLAAKKPVAAVVSTMAASGAYIAAIGADRIFSRGNSIVGSIGVLVEFPNFSGLMEKLGIGYEEIKSSPLKAAPDGLSPTSPEARAAMADLIADSFTWFKDLVKTRRAMSDEELAKIDDGRVFTGRQGVGLKLVDELGGEKEAIDWFVKEKKVAKDLPIRDVPRPNPFDRFGLFSLAGGAFDALGWRWAAGLVNDAAINGGGPQAGLMSIWRVDQ